MVPLAVAFLVTAGLVGLAVWLYRRFRPRDTGRDDRYAPDVLLSPEQVSMIDYLRDCFPDQIVLANVPLERVLTVRRATDPTSARMRLRHHAVDYLVCDAEGRAVFAFDVEQYHLSNAKAKMHQVKLKNRMLKSAGVRFLLLKSSIARMPAPRDFRRQLGLAALPRPKAQEDTSSSPRAQLEARMSHYDSHAFPSTGYRDSEIMGLNSLMGLGQPKTGREGQDD
jgi:Protein of unknown function (DUF2726)